MRIIPKPACDNCAHKCKNHRVCGEWKSKIFIEDKIPKVICGYCLTVHELKDTELDEIQGYMCKKCLSDINEN